jgi:alkylhydroperoxidase family enzyme
LARLTYLNAEDLSDADSHLLDRPINIFRVLAHSPGGLECMVRFGHWIRHESTVSARYRELAILEVGLRHGSEYEFAHHARIAQDFGVPVSAIGDLARRATGQAHALDLVDELVLQAADELSDATTLSNETWRNLQEAFTAEEVVELVLVVTHYVQVVRVLGALRVDLEPEYAPYVDLMRA